MAKQDQQQRANQVQLDRFDIEENIVKAFLAGGERTCRRTVRAVIDTFYKAVSDSGKEIEAKDKEIAALTEALAGARATARDLVRAVDGLWSRADQTNEVSSDDVCGCMNFVRYELDKIIGDAAQEGCDESQTDTAKS